MKYHDFKQQLQPLITFSWQDIYLVYPAFRRATLYDWEKEGRVVKLRNNIYIFGDLSPQNEDYYLIANDLYEPSYVSTELALNHYGVIPEAVPLITSVTTNKTQTFITPIATFSYQTVQPELFFGYVLLSVRNQGAMIASLEKTILDYLYLNANIISPEDFEGLRWNKEVLQNYLDIKKFNHYLAVFSNSALVERVQGLKAYLQDSSR